MSRALSLATIVSALVFSLASPLSAAEPYTIEVVLPLTGPASFLGVAEQKALQRLETVLAKTDGIGGRPVHFVIHDDQSSPQTAVQLATEIVAKKPAVILGSGLVAMCNAMAPLMRRGPVMYCFSPGIHPAPGGYVFSGSTSTKDLAAVQIRYWRLKGVTKIALITSTDASGQDALKNIKEVLAQPENKDMQLVAEQTFNPTDISASAQIERLKAANPQGLIAWSTGAAIGTVFKAIKDAGWDVPVATTNGNMTYAFMDRFAELLPKQLMIPSTEWLQSEALNEPAAVKEAKAQFFGAYDGTGTRPDSASTYSWDPTLIVVDALKKLGPDATADQLRAYLEKLKGVAGVNGIYDFTKVPQRGLDDSNVVVTVWDASKKTWVIISKPRGEPL